MPLIHKATPQKLASYISTRPGDIIIKDNKLHTTSSNAIKVYDTELRKFKTPQNEQEKAMNVFLDRVVGRLKLYGRGNKFNFVDIKKLFNEVKT